MSPTPVTMSLPTAPAVYTWEATNEAVAERYGVRVEDILRFDLNTSPRPPEVLWRALERGFQTRRFETSLSEYPPSDYRRLSLAAAETYGVAGEEVLVGAGADEVLDITAKAFLPPGGGRAVVPIPTYSMYRVVSEQRGATVALVPRLPAEQGWAIDVPAMRAAARESTLIWLCSPNNPTGLAEPPGVVAALLDGLAEDAAADGRTPPAVAVDEAYAEFSGDTVLSLRSTYPNLVVVRTASKAYGLAGLRVGFALARRETLERMEPYRPPGSVGTISITVVEQALRDQPALRETVERVRAERSRLSEAMRAIGWRPGPSVTNFILVDFGTPERAEAVAEGLLRRGIVPRTFGAGHPLNASLRFTVRDPDEDDRLLRSAAEIERALGENAA
ncbi:MAG: histidinol-phosphate aminotransferase family protein [Chloroflexi bacterium]|nr:histidinol-phosphate aminotransferase family protein [Chloroflexota bacterium]